MTVNVVEDVAQVEPQLANCRDYWLGWGEADRSDNGLTYYRSALAHPQLNGVLRLDDADRVPSVARRVSDMMADVPWMWWVGPDSGPGVAEALVGHGAVRVGTMPVMAVRTDRIADAGQPSGLRIDTVEDGEALAEWVDTYSPSFDVAPELRSDSLRIEQRSAQAPDTVRLAAYLDGRCVGTALVLDAHGVAGVYIVTTAEAYRRRGIGAALTAAALRAGQERGLRVGTLQASAAGAPVYRRMGFQTVAEYQLFTLPTA
ncbi:GNAT family N-acetyltransferase [Streptomyces sp. TRM 70361]|uniref:GNAT family N-acetyltransferase n=1 Tax=Streptomyces sp. TRM 70361 TaxID=3116553 RepID=UPI002E7B9B74|nr:GNAT family N-acetyltransferase [Streptomyces sp. TRM 70361]MEE1942400.1 GNAT family N-acetyltransferase [Streptomyces sp. TRM 70361]